MKFSLLLLILCCQIADFQQQKCQKSKLKNDNNLKGGVREAEENISFPGQDEYPITYKMKTVYKFNQNDYILSEEKFNDKEIYERREFKYDKDTIVKEITQTVNGKIISKSIFSKNKNNQVEKISTHKENEKSEIIFTYENSPCLSNSGKEFKNGKLYRSWESEYKNDLATFITTTEAGHTTETFYTYNSNNDIIKVIEKDLAGKILYVQSCEYKYDHKNNWIEQKIYDADKTLIMSIARKIKYW